MTHTFLKRDDNKYQIGMWLPNHEGITAFMAIAEANSMGLAMQIVNYLNGGDGHHNSSIAGHVRIVD